MTFFQKRKESGRNDSGKLISAKSSEFLKNPDRTLDTASNSPIVSVNNNLHIEKTSLLHQKQDENRCQRDHSYSGILWASNSSTSLKPTKNKMSQLLNICPAEVDPELVKKNNFQSSSFPLTNLPILVVPTQVLQLDKYYSSEVSVNDTTEKLLKNCQLPLIQRSDNSELNCNAGLGSCHTSKHNDPKSDLDLVTFKNNLSFTRRSNWGKPNIRGFPNISVSSNIPSHTKILYDIKDQSNSEQKPTLLTSNHEQQNAAAEKKVLCTTHCVERKEKDSNEHLEFQNDHVANVLYTSSPDLISPKNVNSSVNTARGNLSLNMEGLESKTGSTRKNESGIYQDSVWDFHQYTSRSLPKSIRQSSASTILSSGSFNNNSDEFSQMSTCDTKKRYFKKYTTVHPILDKLSISGPDCIKGTDEESRILYEPKPQPYDILCRSRKILLNHKNDEEGNLSFDHGSLYNQTCLNSIEKPDETTPYVFRNLFLDKDLCSKDVIQIKTNTSGSTYAGHQTNSVLVNKNHLLTKTENHLGISTQTEKCQALCPSSNQLMISGEQSSNLMAKLCTVCCKYRANATESDLRGRLADTQRMLSASTLVAVKLKFILNYIILYKKFPKKYLASITQTSRHNQSSGANTNTNQLMTYTHNHFIKYLKSRLDKKETTEFLLCQEVIRRKNQNHHLSHMIRLLELANRSMDPVDNQPQLEVEIEELSSQVHLLNLDIKAKTVECKSLREEVRLLRHHFSSYFNSSAQDTDDFLLSSKKKKKKKKNSDITMKRIGCGNFDSQSPMKNASLVLERKNSLGIVRINQINIPTKIISNNNSNLLMGEACSDSKQANSVLAEEKQDDKNDFRLYFSGKHRDNQLAFQFIREKETKTATPSAATLHYQDLNLNHIEMSKQPLDIALFNMTEQPYMASAERPYINFRDQDVLHNNLSEVAFSVVPVEGNLLYEPVKDDPIDELIADFTNSRERNQILFTRINKGFYLFGRLPVIVEQEAPPNNQKLFVYYSGTRYFLSEFVNIFEKKEYFVFESQRVSEKEISCDLDTARSILISKSTEYSLSDTMEKNDKHSIGNRLPDFCQDLSVGARSLFCHRDPNNPTNANEVSELTQHHKIIHDTSEDVIDCYPKLKQKSYNILPDSCLNLQTNLCTQLKHKAISEHTERKRDQSCNSSIHFYVSPNKDNTADTFLVNNTSLSKVSDNLLNYTKTEGLYNLCDCISERMPSYGLTPDMIQHAKFLNSEKVDLSKTQSVLNNPVKNTAPSTNKNCQTIISSLNKSLQIHAIAPQHNFNAEIFSANPNANPECFVCDAGKNIKDSAFRCRNEKQKYSTVPHTQESMKTDYPVTSTRYSNCISGTHLSSQRIIHQPFGWVHDSCGSPWVRQNLNILRKTDNQCKNSYFYPKEHLLKKYVILNQCQTGVNSSNRQPIAVKCNTYDSPRKFISHKQLDFTTETGLGYYSSPNSTQYPANHTTHPEASKTNVQQCPTANNFPIYSSQSTRYHSFVPFQKIQHPNKSAPIHKKFNSNFFPYNKH